MIGPPHRRRLLRSCLVYWPMMVAVIGEELRHFWQVLFERMSVPRCHTTLSKDAKIRMQHTTGCEVLTLRQERNGDFHSGEVLGTALSAQRIGRRPFRLNGHLGEALQ